MKASEILKTIHRRYEGDTNYPTSGEDFDLRLGFINDAILTWANNENTRWRELITKKTGTTDGTNQIACPPDFVDIMSQVKIGNAVYEFKKPDLARRLLMSESKGKFFFISDTPGAYKININPIPDSGLPYEYYYYRTAPQVSSGNDEVIVPKPMYVVYSVLSSLYEQDNNTVLASVYEKRANDILADMIIQNEAVGGLTSNSILNDDVDYQLYADKLGE